MSFFKITFIRNKRQINVSVSVRADKYVLSVTV
jgi:hypothetical protein